MRVGVIMPLASQRGGAELMLLHLLKANREEGQIEYKLVFLERGPMVETVVSLGYETEVMEAGRVRNVLKYVSLVIQLKRWIRRHKLEVVMSWMTKAHLYAGPAAWMTGTPAIWWQHGVSGKSGLQRIIDLLPARAVVCCSQSVERLQSKALPDMPTKVVYPAIDAELVSRTQTVTSTDARRQLGLPTSGPIVGIAARLQRWKGVHIFVQAAEYVHEQHPDAYFVVIGGEHFSEPQYLNELQEQANQAGLDGRIRFAGHQDNPALWMQAFDIVVHASTDFEPFGMVIIEGMALGKGVIASKSGGPEEILQDGINGLLVKPNDAASLAEAIGRLIDSDEELQTLGQHAQLRAAEFSSIRLALDMATLMNELPVTLEPRPVST